MDEFSPGVLFKCQSHGLGAWCSRGRYFLSPEVTFDWPKVMVKGENRRGGREVEHLRRWIFSVQNRDHAPKTREHAPITRGHAPRTCDHAHKTRDHAPKTRDHAPKTRDHAPKTRDHAPGTRDHAPKTRDHALKTRDRAPKTRDHAPRTRDHSPDSRDCEYYKHGTGGTIAQGETPKSLPLWHFP